MYLKLYYSKNSKICKTSKIYPFTKIVNSKIDSFSYVSYFSHLQNVTVGKYCSIAKRVSVGLGFHPTNFISTSPIFYSPKNPLFKSIVKDKKFEDIKPSFIGNDVWIGANTVILDGVRIGHGSIIGANSVVTKDVEPYSIVGGVPAKLIRKRFLEEEIEFLLKLEWWDKPLDFFIKPEVVKLFSEITCMNRLKQLEKFMYQE
jgi:acetyltransferase-like isoleucine patch superfamily enzyme